ncbi:carbohydrate binding domain-containing protein [Colwelliaceae bacterium BS250]
MKHINKRKHFKQSILVAGLSLAMTACGGSDSSDNDIDELDVPLTVVNTAPKIDSTAALSIEAGQVYTYIFAASDDNIDDTLTLSIDNVPSWLSFDNTTGVLTGTPTNIDAGAYAITLSVSDGADIVRQSFSITVTLSDDLEPAPAAEDFVIFADNQLASWPAWDCCGGSTPVVVDGGGDYGNVVEFSIGAAATVMGFISREGDGAVDAMPYNAFALGDNGTFSFDLKMTASPGDTAWNFKAESNGGPDAGGTALEVDLSTSQEAHPTPLLDTWQTYTFKISDLVAAGLDARAIDVLMIFPAWSTGEGAIYQVDNVIFSSGDEQPPVEPPVEPSAELVVNGSFDDADNNWIGATVIAEGDNNVFQATVDTAGDVWAVNLSQVMTLVAGKTYTLTFKAKAEVGRTIVAGLGFNHDPWTASTEVVSLTTDWATYTYTITPEAGDDNSRVLFDMGGEAGDVYLDDISVMVEGEEPPVEPPVEPAVELVINSGFDDGANNWIGATVIAEGDNNVFEATVTAPGDVWAVNLSQVMTLVAGQPYTLSFKAKAEVGRTIVAGLGFNHDPWTATTEVVTLTTDWATYTYTMTPEAGDDNSRVLFDMGGEAGNVYLDDISVMTVTDGTPIDPVDETRTPGDSGDGATTTTTMGVDFEGPQLTWTSFDTAKVQYVANPEPTSLINDSNSVALFDIIQADGEWIGAKTEGIDNFALDLSNCTVKLDVYKDTMSEVHVKFEKFNGDGWGSAGTKSASNTLVDQWETLTFNFCDMIDHPENDDIGGLAIFPDKTGARSQDTLNYVDNIMFSAGDVVTEPAPIVGTELVVNAGFDDGANNWVMGGAVITEGDNSVFEATVTAPGDVWAVNLSQVMTLVAGQPYTVSFKAKAEVGRTIVAGLGFNHDPWTATTEVVTLTTDWVTYTYTITPDAGDDNSRVLFDMGGEAGNVYLDDISVIVAAQ